MVKSYVNESGYKIRASEKAYKLLYKKNGFKPVKEEAPAKGGSKKAGKPEKASNSPAKDPDTEPKAKGSSADKDTTGQQEDE